MSLELPQTKKTFDSPSAAAHDLLRHVPPSKIADRLEQVVQMAPDLADDLYSSVDVPLQIQDDPSNSKPYIKCDYNRDYDSYRSPYSNKYYPEIPDGTMIPNDLRVLEELGNKAFQAYKSLYYIDGVLSFYAWPIENNVFGCGIFVRKDLDSALRDESPINGSISSTDVFTVTKKDGQNYTYDLISSVLLELNLTTQSRTVIKISGGTTDAHTEVHKASTPSDQIVNIGKMVESYQSEFIERIKSIYVAKMSEILGYLKGKATDEVSEAQKKLLADAMIEVAKRRAQRQ